VNRCNRLRKKQNLAQFSTKYLCSSSPARLFRLFCSGLLTCRGQEHLSLSFLARVPPVGPASFNLSQSALFPLLKKSHIIAHSVTEGLTTFIKLCGRFITSLSDKTLYKRRFGVGANKGVRGCPQPKLTKRYPISYSNFAARRKGTQWRENKSIRLCISELDKLGSGH